MPRAGSARHSPSTLSTIDSARLVPHRALSTRVPPPRPTCKACGAGPGPDNRQGQQPEPFCSVAAARRPVGRPRAHWSGGRREREPSRRDASCPTGVMHARPHEQRATLMMRSSCQVPPTRPSTAVLAVAVLSLLAFPCVHANWQAKGAPVRPRQPRIGVAWLCRCRARSCRLPLPHRLLRLRPAHAQRRAS